MVDQSKLAQESNRNLRAKDKESEKEKKNPHHVMIFGASSGIALEFARPFADRKARFTLIARDEDKLKDISADLYTRGAKNVAIVCYSLDALEGSYAATKEIIKQTEAPDTVLIAHGILGDNDALMKSPQAMDLLFRVNVLSPIGILMALEEAMGERKRGTIAVISSVAGDRGRASNFAYGSTKSAISEFTSGLRARLLPKGVFVLTVKPGMVATAMTEHLPRSPLMASPKKVSRDIIKAISQKTPVLYTPSFWRLIMFIIRHLPEFIFSRLKF
ncbi:MAG: SDR family NAD(P)-dependent oxidoreductase [Oligoflexus sp.]|nr:SDR family NAD(P)-dependent oxidoreductase [Oligoflexus sp.]